MILFRCDWCGREVPAPGVHCQEPPFWPIVEPPRGWKIRQEHLGVGIYAAHQFCTPNCATHWHKHRRWRKPKKRPRAKAV